MKNLFPIMIAAIFLYSCKKQAVADNATPISSLANKNQQTESVTETIQFSGYTWNVRHTGNGTQGPGPNYFNKKNVWVDANGFLHLLLKKNAAGKWLCAEVSSVQNFGYGTYQFQIEGRIDKFNKNTVLGLFNYSGNDGFDEMDIEFARWGNNNYPNLNYTIWPATTGFQNFHQEQEFSLNGTYTTHRFTRTANSVILKSLHGHVNDDTNLFASATCTSPPTSISTLAMPVHMNLWLFQGHAPSDSKSVEIVVHSFSYVE